MFIWINGFIWNGIRTQNNNDDNLDQNNLELYINFSQFYFTNYHIFF